MEECIVMTNGNLYLLDDLGRPILSDAELYEMGTAELVELMRAARLHREQKR